jgi:transposase-like protein
MEKEFQRWTAKRKVALLLQLIKGETKLVDVCREHDLTQSDVESWMEIFLKAGERGLKARTEDEQALHDREVRELRAKVGELVLELDARKKLDALTGKPEKAF